MFSRENFINITVYGIFHFFVDFCCAAIVYSYVGKIDVAQLIILVLLYNGIAFGLQPLIGFFADKTGMARNYAIIGCGILAFSFCFLKFPTVAVCIAALGNAFYHIGGGSVALKLSGGRSLLSGLFVSPGAIGLFLGAFLWKVPSFEILWLSGLMVGGMLIISMLEEPKDIRQTFIFSGSKTLLVLTSLLILISVGIRSFIGLSYGFSQKSVFELMFVFVFAVAAGKAFGGLFADKFGMFNSSVIALLLSLPLLYYAHSPVFEIVGMFLFNFTMPVTLTALADMMPDKKGFAFGLTTLFLLIGAVPPILYRISISHNLIFIMTVSVSIIVTAIGLKIFEKNKKADV